MKRFVIETSNQVVVQAINEWKLADPAKNKKALLTVVSEYDKEKFTEQMNRIQESLKILRENKISDEIMIAYIRSKGVPQSMAKKVLSVQRDFFVRLGVM
jgi:hypothetical protein